VGSNFTEGEDFSKEGTSAGPWMCVYVLQGLTVGWWKEERHSSDTTARSAGFESQSGWASHGCLCLYSCCGVQKKEKGEERVGIIVDIGQTEIHIGWRRFTHNIHKKLMFDVASLVVI
jgi:hypothetical protein